MLNYDKEIEVNEQKSIKKEMNYLWINIDAFPRKRCSS